jgi:hypothetical protein
MGYDYIFVELERSVHEAVGQGLERKACIIHHSH